MNEKCFRSMAKAILPTHCIFVIKYVSRNFKLHIQGSGHFNYILGLHHLFCKKKTSRLKTVPFVISKTSMPQTWHIPQRQYGISAEAFEDIKVLKQIEKERMVLNLNFIFRYNTCCVSIAT